MSATPQHLALLALYAPYCGGLSRQAELERALSQLLLGQLAGERRITQASPHPFQLRWQPVLAPLDTCSCELLFPRTPAVSYRFEIASYQLVAWLMEALASEPPCLPERFWRWLLLGEGAGVHPA